MDREDRDDMSQFPSAANPLSALGLDPDEVRANPGWLQALSAGKVPTNGATSPPPSVTTPTPTAVSMPKEQTPLEDLSRQGITGELRTAKTQEDLAKTVGTVDPSIAAAQKARDLAQDRASSFNDAAYRPSIGSRIWRGVRGGLTGLALGGIPGAIAGAVDPGKVGSTPYGAPNAAGQTEANRLLREQLTSSRTYDEALANWKQAQAARKEELAATKDTNVSYGGAAGHATAELNAENKPDSANKTDEKLRLDQAEIDQRRKNGIAVGLKGKDLIDYSLGYKPEKPEQPNEAVIQQAMRNKVISEFTRQNGHPPQTDADYEAVGKRIAALSGRPSKPGGGQSVTQARIIADKKNASIQRALAEYAKDPGQPESNAELQRSLQEAQNAYEEESGLLGDGGDVGPHQVVTVDAKGQATWTPVAQTAPAPAPGAPPAAGAPKGPPPGATHTVKSKKDNKLHW